MLSAFPTRGCLSGGMNVQTLHVSLIAVLVLTGIRAGAQKAAAWPAAADSCPGQTGSGGLGGRRHPHHHRRVR
jgi:hypothetical protein